MTKGNVEVQKVEPDKAIDVAAHSERVSARTRIPMSTGQLKLKVAPIPGFHLHWMNGSPERLQAAIQAGYEFVRSQEVNVINPLLGGDALKSGNTDMGTRVSVLADPNVGSKGDDGQPLRLYLMKIREEWYQDDQLQQEVKSRQFLEAIQGGNTVLGESGDKGIYGNKSGTDVSGLLKPKRVIS